MLPALCQLAPLLCSACLPALSALTTHNSLLLRCRSPHRQEGRTSSVRPENCGIPINVHCRTTNVLVKPRHRSCGESTTLSLDRSRGIRMPGRVPFSAIGGPGLSERDLIAELIPRDRRNVQ
jgi:hypothetical protein